MRVPLPLVSVVNDIHETLLEALHEQSLRVCTTKEPEPPDAGNEALDGLMSYVQGSGVGAFCETVNVWPAIVSMPGRTAPVPLSVAL
jgi:hypothetical protein